MEQDNRQTSELLKKVRKIEIKTKGLSNQIFSGEYHSSFKGRGMSFSEVREYQHGDEIRTIDWNVTARFNHPYIKIFEEERELTLMLLVDVSKSGDFGTKTKIKRETITEISAVLSFSALQNNDKVGVILFSDKIEKFIPPKKGKSHILAIIKTLLDFKSKSEKTDINQALQYFNKVCKKKSMSFLISDFQADLTFKTSLQIVRKKHDFIALKVSDNAEKELPNIGFVPLIDAESKKLKWVNTSSKKERMLFAKKANEHQEKLDEMLKKTGTDYANISNNEDYVRPLMALFKKRHKR